MCAPAGMMKRAPLPTACILSLRFLSGCTRPTHLPPLFCRAPCLCGGSAPIRQGLEAHRTDGKPARREAGTGAIAELLQRPRRLARGRQLQAGCVGVSPTDSWCASSVCLCAHLCLLPLQIPTRTVIQIRTHAQKYFQKLAKTGQPSPEPPEGLAAGGASSAAGAGGSADEMVEEGSAEGFPRSAAVSAIGAACAGSVVTRLSWHCHPSPSYLFLSLFVSPAGTALCCWHCSWAFFTLFLFHSCCRCFWSSRYGLQQPCSSCRSSTSVHDGCKPQPAQRGLCRGLRCWGHCCCCTLCESDQAQLPRGGAAGRLRH